MFCFGGLHLLIHTVCWVSYCPLLIHTSSGCCVIRGKKKTHLNESPSQINHRIPNVTLLNSHLTTFLYSKSIPFSKSKTEYTKTRYQCKNPTTEKAVLSTYYGL